MNLTNVGDLSLSTLLKRQTATVKTEVERLSVELTTGRTTDVTRVTRGDLAPLAEIDRSIRTLTSYQNSAGQTQLFFETAQRSFDLMQELATTTGSNLLATSSGGSTTIFGAATEEARQNFEAVVSALNTSVGGRFVFGGTATGTLPVEAADVMLADIQTVVTGLTTSADIVAAVDTWFDTAGGSYETLGYLGSTTNLSPFELGLGVQASFNSTAFDTEIRTLLKGFALASVMEEGFVGLNPTEERNLMAAAGETLMSADGMLSIYRSSIGKAEQQVSDAINRNTIEMSSLELARAEIVAVDTYGAASDLEAASFQLETVFTLTARLQRLSLVNYL